jgi:hypothetical protein
MKMMTHDKMGGQGVGFEGSGWATDAAITLDPPDPVKSGPFCAPRAPFAARRARALGLGGGCGSDPRAADSWLGFPVRPAPLVLVSPEKIFPSSQDQVREEFVKLVQDLHSQGNGHPIPHLDLRRAVLADGGTDTPSKMASNSRPRKEMRSVQDLNEDPPLQISQPRIPVSEKSKWSAACPPGSPHTFNAVGALNSSSVLSHQRAGGGDFAPCIDGRPKPVALDVNDGDWSVVKPRYWWCKNMVIPERAPQKQQIDVKGTNLFKLKLQGKCYNCLSPEHFAFRCSAPTRC